MTLKEFIKAHYTDPITKKPSQAAYAKAMGFAESSVSRWVNNGCLVDHSGWPHPKLMKRKERKLE